MVEMTVQMMVSSTERKRASGTVVLSKEPKLGNCVDQLQEQLMAIYSEQMLGHSLVPEASLLRGHPSDRLYQLMLPLSPQARRDSRVRCLDQTKEPEVLNSPEVP